MISPVFGWKIQEDPEQKSLGEEFVEKGIKELTEDPEKEVDLNPYKEFALKTQKQLNSVKEKVHQISLKLNEFQEDSVSAKDFRRSASELYHDLNHLSDWLEKRVSLKRSPLVVNEMNKCIENVNTIKYLLDCIGNVLFESIN